MEQRAHDNEGDYARPQARTGDGRGGEGKRSLTQGLSPRPIIFRVESAEAARELGAAFGPRDPNGVAAGAEVVVQRAASSASAGLRPDVRERFESSLGADLSAVRLHTGQDSAEAASAVGARAYTEGNDIHFGAGQYQPDDPFGMHLLAHEVAHTQQQAGGASRRQHKLEVSAPADAAEVEADRAADAMVVGQPTSVGRGSGLARVAAPPIQVAQSIKKGPLEIEIAASTDGKIAASGSLSVSAAAETGIPGVFVEAQGGGKVNGEGTLNPDGSATIAVAAELNGQATINGGIQKIASVYGGLAFALKFPGLTLNRSAAGVWAPPELGKTISFTGKAIVGAKIDAVDQLKGVLPKGWDPGTLKYEISPGGEKEIAILDTGTGKVRQGKDLAAMLRTIDNALVTAGLKDAAPTKAESGVQGAAAAAKAAVIAKAKREAEEKAARAAALDKDKAEYDAANNPEYQTSTAEPRDPNDELTACE